jgi:predicted component of type VI protein secretion system
MELRLKILAGSHAGQEMRIGKAKFLVGRSEECNLRPNSEKVSRHHCVFLLGDGRATIRDLGSRNGTLVNGEKVVGEVELKKGDQLEIGPLQFEVRLIDVPEVAEAVPVQSAPVVVASPEAKPIAPATRTPVEVNPAAAVAAEESGTSRKRAESQASPDDIATWLLDQIPSSDEDTKDFSKTDILLNPMGKGPQGGTKAPPLPDPNAAAEALRKLQRRKRS